MPEGPIPKSSSSGKLPRLIHHGIELHLHQETISGTYYRIPKSVENTNVEVPDVHEPRSVASRVL